MKQLFRLENRRGLIAVILLFILINLLAAVSLRTARLDLTEQKLHTLTEGTRNILHNLDKPLTLQFYWSKQVGNDLPGLKIYADRVLDLLNEYALHADGKLILETVDPEPFSDAEDDAVKYGLQGVPVDGRSGQTLYFGLVGKSDDGTSKTIPFFQPERESFLEYDVSELVTTLATPQKIVLGLLSALDMDGRNGANPFAPSEPWMIVDQLQQRFDLRPLDRESVSIPDEVTVLMVVYPEGLDDSTLYAIDQFVLRGGRLLLFADPLSETLRGQAPQGAPEENPTLVRLLKTWGVELHPDAIAGDPQLAQRVQVSGGLRPQVMEYLPWMALQQEQFNPDEVVTSQLGQINLACAGVLTPLDDAKTDFVPLISTSEAAGIISRPLLSYGANPAQLLADHHPGGKPLTLAARLSGPTESAFDAAPALPEGVEGQRDAHLVKAQDDIQVVIVSDADLLEDRFWVQVNNFFGQRLAVPTAANADFAINVIEQLGGNSDLISVRSRGSAARPFELVSEIRRRAEQQYRVKEQELTRNLQQTEAKLNELQRQRQDAASATLTPEQEKEVQKFVDEKVKTRKKLREVQYGLRHEIDDLNAMLKLFNIAFMPMFISLVAFVAWLIRRSRGRSFSL